MQEGRRASAGQVLVAIQLALAGKSSVRPPVQPVPGLEVVRLSDQIWQDPLELGEPAKRHLPTTQQVDVTATPATKYARKVRRRRGRVSGRRVAYSARRCHIRNF